MPFAVFRRHQRKMLGIIALMAMFAFVVTPGAYRPDRGPGGGNVVVVDLDGKPVYRSDLNAIAEERAVANRFLTGLGAGPNFFGNYSNRDLVDAMILRREADRLGIPDSPEFAQAWLKQVTATGMMPMNRQIFDAVLRQMGPDVGGEQVLQAIASQLRLVEALRLTGGPLVTPLDVYEAYRDQAERSSFRYVSFPAANYLDKVGEPSDADVRSLYETYKDVLPDPSKDTPGFKVPRKVKLEVLAADGPAMAKKIQGGLTEKDLKEHYEAHKSDFAIIGTLPTDLFKGDPKAALTPPQYTPFAAVKDALAVTVAREKAQEQITETFDAISRKVDDAADDYHRAIDDNEEAKKEGSTRTVPVPIPAPLDAVAKENGLAYEATPMLSEEEARHYGQVSAATQGSNATGKDQGKFADVVFAAKTPLYEAMEFVDAEGRRFLARKIEDVPAHVAPLDEVRPEVVAAWRLDKARALAEAAAKELAEKVKKDGGKFPGEVVDGRPVRAIEAVSKLRSGMPMVGPGGGIQFGPPTPAELPIPDAGDALRRAIFGLKPGAVAVQPDAPKANYYVVTLDRRDPATFAGLYGPMGLSQPYFNEAVRDASEAERKRRLESLRAQAGLKADWVPPDERDRQEESPRAG